MKSAGCGDRNHVERRNQQFNNNFSLPLRNKKVIQFNWFKLNSSNGFSPGPSRWHSIRKIYTRCIEFFALMLSFQSPLMESNHHIQPSISLLGCERWLKCVSQCVKIFRQHTVVQMRNDDKREWRKKLLEKLLVHHQRKSSEFSVTLQFGQNNGPSPSLSSSESSIMLRQDLIMYTVHSNYQTQDLIVHEHLNHTTSHRPSSRDFPRHPKRNCESRWEFVADLMMLTKKKFDEGRIDECSRFLIQLNINHSRSLGLWPTSSTSEIDSSSSRISLTATCGKWKRERRKSLWKLFKFASKQLITRSRFPIHPRKFAAAAAVHWSDERFEEFHKK